MQLFLQHEDINNGKKNFYEPDRSSYGSIVASHYVHLFDINEAFDRVHLNQSCFG
jgi:hypothetical protein